jgi:hypothetical protein
VSWGLPPRADCDTLAHRQADGKEAMEGEDEAKDAGGSSPARPSKPAATNNDPFCRNYVLAEQKGVDVALVRALMTAGPFIVNCERSFVSRVRRPLPHEGVAG